MRKSKARQSKRLEIRISDELLRKALLESRRRGVTVSELVRQALEQEIGK